MYVLRDRPALLKWIQTYDTKSLSQHFEKEIYQYVNTNIAKFLRAPILKNIFKRLLLEMSSWDW